MQLQKLETDAQLDVPRDAGRQVKMLSNDPKYALAWRFMLDQLAGIRRLSFVPGVEQSTEMMFWREGRRFVGEWLQRIADAPMPDETPPQPPARTITERARRRATKSETT